jgi:hypothetical protein
MSEENRKNAEKKPYIIFPSSLVLIGSIIAFSILVPITYWWLFAGPYWAFLLVILPIIIILSIFLVWLITISQNKSRAKGK